MNLAAFKISQILTQFGHMFSLVAKTVFDLRVFGGIKTFLLGKLTHGRLISGNLPFKLAQQGGHPVFIGPG